MASNGNETGLRPNQDTEQNAVGLHTQPSSPSTTEQKQKKKKGGFLSFLGCCGAPDIEDGQDGEDENVHKLDTLPQRTTTSKARHQGTNENSSRHAADKTQQGVNATEGETLAENSSSVDAVQSLPDQKQTGAVEPVNSVDESAVAVEQQRHAANDDEQIIQDATNAHAYVTQEDSEDQQDRTIPPPPPGPGPVATTEIESADSRKWLLPPVAPEHKGRKCLVLDLDETLVHSSFKVWFPQLHSYDLSFANRVIDPTPRRHHDPC